MRLRDSDDEARQLARAGVGQSVRLVFGHILPVLSQTYPVGSPGGVSTIQQVGYLMPLTRSEHFCIHHIIAGY